MTQAMFRSSSIKVQWPTQDLALPLSEALSVFDKKGTRIVKFLAKSLVSYGSVREHFDVKSQILRGFANSLYLRLPREGFS